MIANITLSTKEKLLLQDQKGHEEICIQKYTSYANLASDKQLKDIFTSNANQEKEHLNTINQLLSGQVPDTNSSSKQGGNNNQQQQQAQPQGVSTSFGLGSSSNPITPDKDLCTDILMTEKYVSGTYDTAIFEFSDPQVRQVLNHIQKEEQEHGEKVFKYMESKGMYNTK
ncbi:MAG: hypothetical protein K0S47_141 [Herbinix sp.]|jgi:spore coat protein CotF|nr:hypothetical protein [Herbinix sp.]